MRANQPQTARESVHEETSQRRTMHETQGQAVASWDTRIMQYPTRTQESAVETDSGQLGTRALMLGHIKGEPCSINSCSENIKPAPHPPPI